MIKRSIVFSAVGRYRDFVPVRNGAAALPATSPVVGVEIDFGSCTDVGNRRELNEDAVLAAFPVFAVADGMGGHAAGEVAAALAIDTMSRLSGQVNVRSEDVLGAISAANAAIVAYEQQQSDAAGMGTTLAGICLGVVAGSPHWFVFNIGDSRVYRYEAGEMRQLTVDHSEVAELVAAGQISVEQASTHPSRSVVTRSLGLGPQPVPDLWVRPTTPGERFLVCSDGLSLELSDEAIATELAVNGSPQVAAKALVGAAVAAGGHDNVSAVVVDLQIQQDDYEIDVDTSA